MVSRVAIAFMCCFSIFMFYPIVGRSDPFSICPSLSDEYSWLEFTGGIPMVNKDPNAKNGIYFVVETLFEDDVKKQENDPFSRILGGTDYTIWLKEKDGPYYVSGVDDYRNCSTGHYSENSGFPNGLSIYGRRLLVDQLGRVFDEREKIYIGNLSCVVKQRGLTLGRFFRSIPSCGDQGNSFFALECQSPERYSYEKCREWE